MLSKLAAKKDNKKVNDKRLVGQLLLAPNKASSSSGPIHRQPPQSRAAGHAKENVLANKKKQQQFPTIPANLNLAGIGLADGHGTAQPEKPTLTRGERAKQDHEIARRRSEFQKALQPSGLEKICEFTRKGLTNTRFLWGGWMPKQIMPRFCGVLIGRTDDPTMAGLQRVELKFRVESGEVIVVYAWGHCTELLRDVDQFGHVYTITSTKCMDNSGTNFRAGDFAIRLLVQDNSMIFSGSPMHGLEALGGPRIEYPEEGETEPRPPKEYMDDMNEEELVDHDMYEAGAGMDEDNDEPGGDMDDEFDADEAGGDGDARENEGEEEEDEEEEEEEEGQEEEEEEEMAMPARQKHKSRKEQYEEQQAEQIKALQAQIKALQKQQQKQPRTHEGGIEYLCTKPSAKKRQGGNNEADQPAVKRNKKPMEEPAKKKKKKLQTRDSPISSSSSSDNDDQQVTKGTHKAANKQGGDKQHSKRRAQSSSESPVTVKRVPKEAADPNTEHAGQDDEVPNTAAGADNPDGPSTTKELTQFGLGPSRAHGRRCRRQPSLDSELDPRDDGWPESGSSSSSNGSAVDDTTLERYFTIEQWEEGESMSRGTVTESCRVRFHDFEESPRPHRLLEQCVAQLLDRVLANRPAPRLLGFQLQCEQLHKPFYVPLRSPAQNTAAVIAAALENVCAQSADGLDLFTAAAETKVLAVWSQPRSGVRKSTHRGQGACSNVEHGGQLQRRPCQSYVQIRNPGDRWCLAHAVIIGLLDRRCRLLGHTRAQFRAMCARQHPHGGMAAEILRESGCQLHKQHYGVPDLCRLQQWLDARLGAHEVRLFVLERAAAYQVMWKAPARARFNLCLVFTDRHYDYAHAYCVECERRVEARSHPDGCRAVCYKCMRFGFEQPCQRWQDGTPARRCVDCGFLFPNPECFAAHRHVVDPTPPGYEGDGRRRPRPRLSMCAQRRHCRQCGAVVHARAGRAQHDCQAARFHAQQFGRGPAAAIARRQQQQQPRLRIDAAGNCTICEGVHTEQQPCFIQPRGYEKQCQLATANNEPMMCGAPENVEDDAAELPPPLSPPNNDRATCSSDDDDDAVEEEEDAPILEHAHNDGNHAAAAAARKPIRFLWWDVESCQQQHAPNTLKHVPILICAEVLCELCIAERIRIQEDPERRAEGCVCLVRMGAQLRQRWCMPLPAGLAHLTVDGRNPRRFHFHQFDEQQRQQPAAAAAQNSPMAQFVDFLLHHGRMQCTTIALSHNGGRYDMHLMMEELQRRGVRPKRLISNGLKFYVMELGGLHQRHVLSKDTLHFFTCPLSALPRTFGLPPDQCVAKPYFPYGWIRPENLHTRLDGLPPVECYEPGRMKADQRSQFVDWYRAQQQRRPRPQFQLAEQLLEYCANDVAILRESVIRFRDMIGQISGGLEPFLAASSVAGLAMAIYRKCFLPPNKLVHTPEGGLRRGRRASCASRRFFALLERLSGKHIRTAQWAIGEEQPDDCGLRIDGVVRRRPPLLPLAIEYLGCYFHGCPQCYPQREQRLAGGQTAATLLAHTEARSAELERRGYAVRHVWECEFQQRLRRDLPLRRRFQQIHVAEPLDLRRHAYFGGRVEPFRFYHRCANAQEEIIYIDIVSLYPWVMKNGSFPLGHPTVWTREQLIPRHRAELPWRRAQQQPYRGYIFCRVLPPRGGRLLHGRPPLLPYRATDGRLLFPLCAACAERRQQRRCQHAPRERSWVAAYTHEELNRALGLHYQVWEYTEWAQIQDGNGLFTGYVNEFLKIKAQSSGWPAGCQTEAQRAAYLREFAEREGVHLSLPEAKRTTGKSGRPTPHCIPLDEKNILSLPEAKRTTGKSGRPTPHCIPLDEKNILSLPEAKRTTGKSGRPTPHCIPLDEKNILSLPEAKRTTGKSGRPTPHCIPLDEKNILVFTRSQTDHWFSF